ncbi:MAG: TatD family hydrolase [Holosporales bacterium]|jgi:TatD DNase family protein|nr:TatD family hydrolase [Holosporales bacterium]
MIDSHCHLTSFDDLDNVIARAKNAKVSKIVTIGTELNDFEKMNVINSEFSEFVDVVVGVHPDNCLSISLKDIEEYFKKIDIKNIIGIGEIGLDYKNNPNEVIKKKQKEFFEIQLSFASDNNLPVCIHMRESSDDILDILRNFSNIRGVFHCFSENKQFAKKALDIGFFISFSGIVTFKNAKAVQESAVYVPLNRMLFETDAPYLAPTPHRGKRNEPAYVSLVYDFVSNLKDISKEDLVNKIYENFKSLFFS